MAEIIARFADGRLLVQEERPVTKDYTSGIGTPIRIGLVKTVEKILSLDSYVSGRPLARVGAPLAEAVASGDTVLVRLRRTDLMDDIWVSGSPKASTGYLSGITSGLTWNEELASGIALISGRLKILANIIGY